MLQWQPGLLTDHGEIKVRLEIHPQDGVEPSEPLMPPLMLSVSFSPQGMHLAVETSGVVVLAEDVDYLRLATAVTAMLQGKE